MDFEAGVLRVRQQLSRHRTPKPLKTDAARREVVLAPAGTRLLRERWLASSYKDAEHLVFSKTNGRGSDYRAAGDVFRAAAKRAGLHGQGRLSLHSLRHSFGSLLIAKEFNVVFVSQQLGHASPATALEVYAHLFEQLDDAATAREALEASYQTMVGTSGRGDERNLLAHLFDRRRSTRAKHGSIRKFLRQQRGPSGGLTRPLRPRLRR